MAGIGNKFVDLIDIYKSQNPKGDIAVVVEMLMKMNPMLKDAYAIECNDGSSHQHSIRTGLPPVAWGKLYKGIVQGKSTKANVKDTTGFVEGLSTIDTRVLKKAGDKAGALRLSEAKAYLESIAQEVQKKMIYGNSASSPEEFMGLAPRFNDPTAKNGNQIINGGGTGSDNTSVWMITWGDNECHTLYPEASQAGVKREDKGEQRVLDDAGNPYYVKEELFCQEIGLAVKDWRYVSRICNIDVSDLVAGTVDIYKLFRKMYYSHEGRRTKKGNTVIYCNTDVLEALDAAQTNSGSSDNFVRLGTKEIQGEDVDTYRKIPIRETDAILNTEEAITGF
jgi:hypothetical protein